MLRRLGAVTGVVAALVLATAPAARGHTQFVEMIPPDEAVLEVSPPEVIVVFSAPLQEERSSIVVLDTDNATVAEGGLDPADATRLVADLPPLEPGRYLVRYTAYSADNELIRDQLEFEVAVAATPPPTPTAAPTPTPAASAEAPTQTPPPATVEPTPQPSPQPSDEPDDGDEGGGDMTPVLIPLLVGGAIVAAAAMYLIRRRQP